MRHNIGFKLFFVCNFFSPSQGRNTMISKNRTRQFLILTLLFLFLFPQSIRSQDTTSASLEPTTTPYGTVGMANVISAEPFGEGRLGVQLRGNYYQQNKTVQDAAPKNTQVLTLTFGAALGINPYLDGFVCLGAYNLHGGGVSGSGAGTAVLGVQGSLPLPEDYPVRLGLQVASLFGIAGKQIDTTQKTTGEKGAYGYNYLETRKSTDFMARFVQSYILGDVDMGVKFHLNEGVVSSFEKGKDVLLVTGAGVQYIVMPPLVLGLEINDRTFLSKPLLSDPLWVTPSVVYRTPIRLNIEAGADISLSSNRVDGNRTLEPWRGFVSLNISYDTRADKKKAEAMEKTRLANTAKAALAA